MVPLQHDAFKARMRSLSPRELQVMPFVATGKPNKLIACELHLSQRTVESHRARLFRKMGLRNAAELASCCAVYLPYMTPPPRFTGDRATLYGNPAGLPAAH